MANSTARPAAAQGIHQALLEYQAVPGRFDPARRQPPLLFSAVDDVLHIATGKSGSVDSVRQAALFFVRHALLAPGADHYCVLGVPTKARADQVKKRYRLLMRLLHPDFAVDDDKWPADAAVRVNLAYETLSSPERRRIYDAKNIAAPAVIEKTAPVRPAPAGRNRPPIILLTRAWRMRAAMFASFGVAMLLMSVLVLLSPPAENGLVQRLPEEKAAAPRSTFDAVVLAAQNFSNSVVQASPFRKEREPAPSQRAAQAGDALAQATAGSGAPSRVSEAAPATPADPEPQLAPPQASPPSAVLPASPAVVAQAVPAGAQAQPAPPPAPAPTSAPALQTLPATAAITATAAVVPLVPAVPAPVRAPVAAPAIAAAPPPAPSMGDAHLLLTQLIQLVETGRGDELLSMLERGARTSPDAQALARELDSTAKGARPRVTNVQFRSEGRDGRLLVRGNMKLLLGDATRDFQLQAEFGLRGGRVVLTRLAPVS